MASAREIPAEQMAGLRRYLYEWIIHQAVEAIPERATQYAEASGETVGAVADLTASQGRAFRRRVEENLRSAGFTMGSAEDPNEARSLGGRSPVERLGLRQLMVAINQAQSEMLPDLPPKALVFADAVESSRASADPLYQSAYSSFMSHVGVEARRESRSGVEYVINRGFDAMATWAGVEPTPQVRRDITDAVGRALAAGGTDPAAVGFDTPEAMVAAMDAFNRAQSAAYPNSRQVFAAITGAQDPTQVRGWTGLASGYAAEAGRTRLVATESSGAGLPVSPYDPRWSNRQVALTAGVRPLAMPPESMAMATNLASLHQITGRTAGDMEMVFLEQTRDTADGEVHERAGVASSMSDRTGLSALAPYLSAAEMREARRWMARSEVRDVGEEAVSRSVELLRYMAESGIEYSVGLDREPGQLQARIEGTSMSVRLTDPKYPDYIGRVWDSGVVVNFSTPEASPDATTYTPRVEEVTLPMRFALGQPLRRLDDPNKLVGALDSEDRLQTSYHTAEASTHRLDATRGLSLRVERVNRRNATAFIADQPAAERMLRDAVASAREKVAAELDVAGLIELAEAHADDPDFEPEFDGDEALMALRRDYWDMLRGEDIQLLAPGYTPADYRAAAGTAEAAKMEVTMNPAHNVRQRVALHAHYTANHLVGQYDPDEDGKRFDPVGVAKYMTTGTTAWGNTADVTAALRKSGIDPSELKGEQFYNRVIVDNMITFDEETAIDMASHPDAEIAGFADDIATALQSRAATPTSIKIDDRGVVRWEAVRQLGRSGSSSDRNVHVTGEIGQFFPRGEYGEIVTDYNSGDNHMLVPGYEAVVVDDAPGESTSLEQRTRLRGYRQVMSEAIYYRVANDVGQMRTEVGTPTSVNSVLRRLYDTRHPADFLESSAAEGMSYEDREAILRTEGLRVRYPNSVTEGSTAMGWFMAAERGEITMRNDMSRDGLVRTGGRNMALLEPKAAAGIFDPIMAGMARNQGSVRYLVPSATVNADGSIIPGDPTDRVPVAATSHGRAMGYDTWDRQNMSLSNLMRASSVASGARTAMTQLNGWNFEDGMIVSTSFAAGNRIRGTDGQLRNLLVGDKLSDSHGNKGVISLIVDPQMDMADAEAAGIADVVRLYADNPDLDVVMSPFSAISRFNGGTARELMEDPQALQLRDNDGSVITVPGGMGSLDMIITKMSVDAKTNIYDDEAVAAGRGRKASSQLAWALHSQQCPKVLEDLFGDNERGFAAVREFSLLLGADLSPTGDLVMGVHPESPERKVVTLPEPVYNARGSLNVRQTRTDFFQQVAHSGGVLELPFPVTLATGEQTPEAPAADGSGRTVYHLPLLSSSLRAEQDLGDGSVSRHDYTLRYWDIAEQALKYQAQVDAGGNPDPAQFAARAQATYNRIADDVIARKIETKDNMFKELIMGHRVPNSASAVWTGDPRLGVDEVAMNSTMAAQLGAVVDGKGNGRVLLWRDPVLRDGALRYMKVVINDELTGVAVNPVSVKSMDGDFDGDSVGLVGNLSPEAHAEAMDKLTVEANLLDLGRGELAADGSVNYELSLHDNLDIQVAAYAGAIDRGDIDEIVERLNETHAAHVAGEIDRAEFLDQNRHNMGELNELYQTAFANKNDIVALRFDSMSAHMESVRRCATTGAKGSDSKLADYSVYIGAREEGDGVWADTGAPDFDDIKQRYRESQMATAIKDEWTGVAGKTSQDMVQLLRSQGKVRAACEISAPATHATLQSKHSALDAMYRARMLSGPVQDLKRGRLLEFSIDDDGRLDATPVKRDGQYVQATADQWVEQYERLYTSDEGMGVAVGHDVLAEVAESLSDDAGVMRDTSRESWSQWPSEQRPLVLDQLAYGVERSGDNRGFAVFKQLAEKKSNVFEGLAADFAPSTVRDNIKKVDDMIAGYIPADTELSPVAARDVSADPVKHRPSPSRIRVSAPAASAVTRTAELVEPTPLPAGLADLAPAPVADKADAAMELG